MVRDNIADVIKGLEEIGENFVNWFLNNEIKLNNDKCHLLLNSQEPKSLKIGDWHINNSVSEKLLGITFDCKLKLKFKKHRRYWSKNITEGKRTSKTWTIHGNNQKAYSYEWVFQVTM